MTPTTSAEVLDLLLRTALGDRLERLSADERESLAQEFLRGGMHSVLARNGTAQEAAAALAHAQLIGQRARARIGTETTPFSPPVISEADWQPIVEVVEELGSAIATLPNVVGVGPSLRVREGIREADRCLTIYVEEKLSPEELRDRGYTMLEPYLQGANGARVPTDVVELGTLHRQALAGDSVSEVGKSRRGTLGAFATDLLEGGIVGITAMHVLNPVAGASIDCVCPGHGMSGSEPLGSFRRGRMARIDAALMSTERAGATRNFLPGLGKIRGWRSVTLSGDRNLPVLMWGAESGTLMNGVLREPLIHLPSENLQSAILAEIESIDGDSGAALLDEDNWILGFLVGTVGPPGKRRRVFTPAALVMNLLECDITSAS